MLGCLVEVVVARRGHFQHLLQEEVGLAGKALARLATVHERAATTAENWP